MLVYRISSSKYAGDLSGTGASLYGGRWNKKGAPVLYTGGSKEIALLETIVHLPPMLGPKLDILTLQIPENDIHRIEIKDLPSNWFSYPAPTYLADIGAEWIREIGSLVLRVPSCIIHSADIFVINCKHPRFSEIQILEQKRFYFDSRLVR